MSSVKQHAVNTIHVRPAAWLCDIVFRFSLISQSRLGLCMLVLSVAAAHSSHDGTDWSSDMCHAFINSQSAISDWISLIDVICGVINNVVNSWSSHISCVNRLPLLYLNTRNKQLVSHSERQEDSWNEVCNGQVYGKFRSRRCSRAAFTDKQVTSSMEGINFSRSLLGLGTLWQTWSYWRALSKLWVGQLGRI